jgi:hypothetical protein
MTRRIFGCNSNGRSPAGIAAQFTLTNVPLDQVTTLVNSLGNQFLAGSGLPIDQHGGCSRGHGLHHAEHASARVAITCDRGSQPPRSSLLSSAVFDGFASSTIRAIDANAGSIAGKRSQNGGLNPLYQIGGPRPVQLALKPVF